MALFKTNIKNIYAFNKVDFDNGTKGFNEHFFLNAQQEPIKNDTQYIKLSSLEKLVNEVKEIDNRSYSASSDVAALNMIYGLQNDRLVIIFQPVFLHPKTQRIFWFGLVLVSIWIKEMVS